MDPQRPTRPAPRPRRHSRRTYIVRRIVVTVALLGVVYGVVFVVTSLFGDDTTTSADGPTSTNPDVSSVGSPADPATTSTTIATTTTTAPAVNVAPSPTAPATVLLLGDSEAGGLSPFLKPVIEQTGVVSMELDYKVSTGLVRDDFYDWPARLREQLPVVQPDIVIALFGGNDGQSFIGTTDKVDSPEWRAKYAERVAEVIEIIAAEGRTLIWVGVPNAGDEGLTDRLRVQNEVVVAELAKHPEVAFVNAWDYFTGIDGGFAPYVVDPRDGESKAVRSPEDLFHLNTTGEEILARYVADKVIADLVERGAVL